jgi:hypothetical protein
VVSHDIRKGAKTFRKKIKEYRNLGEKLDII